MITSLFALVVVSSQKAPSAADFFPLNPGDKFVFEEEFQKDKKVFTDVVGQPEDVKGRLSFPVETFFLARESMGRVFYHVEGDRVLVTSLGKGAELASPYPVLIASSSPKSFSWTGEIPITNGAPEPLSLAGECRPGKQMDLFGKKRATLEVTVTSDMAGMVAVQKSVYAEGLGLVSMVEETGKRKIKRTRKLVDYQPSQGS